MLPQPDRFPSSGRHTRRSEWSSEWSVVAVQCNRYQIKEVTCVDRGARKKKNLRELHYNNY